MQSKIHFNELISIFIYLFISICQDFVLKFSKVGISTLLVDNVESPTLDLKLFALFSFLFFSFQKLLYIVIGSWLMIDCGRANEWWHTPTVALMD